MHNDLARVCSIARSWNLRLKIKKCVAMRFGACNAGNNFSSSYSIDNSVTSHRNLGVFVDSQLHLHDHLHKVVWKAGGLASELLHSTICCSSIFMITYMCQILGPLWISVLMFGMGAMWVTDCWRVCSKDGQKKLLVSAILLMWREERLKALELFSIFGQLPRADLIKC